MGGCGFCPSTCINVTRQAHSLRRGSLFHASAYQWGCTLLRTIATMFIHHRPSHRHCTFIIIIIMLIITLIIEDGVAPCFFACEVTSDEESSLFFLNSLHVHDRNQPALLPALLLHQAHNLIIPLFYQAFPCIYIL